MGDTFWGRAQPVGNGNCMQLWWEDHYEWDDVKCDREAKLVCEYKLGECEGGQCAKLEDIAGLMWKLQPKKPT